MQRHYPLEYGRGMVPALTAPNRAALEDPGGMSQELVRPLRLAVEQRMPWTILHVSGDLDWGSHGRFENCLTEMVTSADQPRICIDLSGLDFCDSSGLASMVRAWHGATGKGGALALLRPDANLARRLVLIGLDKLLPVVDELPD